MSSACYSRQPGPLKLGGLTWWRGNYGSILQAYALARVLNAMDGVEYEVIDQYGSVRSVRGVFERLRGKKLRDVWIKLSIQHKVPSLSKRARALQSFIDVHLPISPVSYGRDAISEANARYDGFVCGSDQIWNPECAGLNSMYWLGFAESGKTKVAYAPSLGVAQLNPEQKMFVRKMASSFDALSCREVEGAELISSAAGRECANVADPTMLIPAGEWKGLSSCSRYASYEGPYIFAYILRGNEAQRRLVEDFAEERGLKVVNFPYLEPEYAVSYDGNFGDERVYDADPFDFIALIAGAEYVFTDSFHCCVFSSMMHKEFFLFPKKGKAQSSRLENLQKTLGISSRLVSDIASVRALAEKNEIDWRESDDRLSEIRSASIAWLEEAIGLCR